MRKEVIGIFVMILLIASATLPALGDLNNKTEEKELIFDETFYMLYPQDFELDVYCGGISFWEEWYRIQIDSDGHGIYSILYAEDRETADYSEIDQFDLTQNEMDQLWDQISTSDFFNLNEIYSESDLFPDSDILISGGTFANIIITANGNTHMVETRHIGLTEFDNIMLEINSLTPGDYDLFYNGLFNSPPFTPASPQGPASGNYRQEHTYTTSGVDMDQDDLYYRFDWGNDDISEWIGPFESGEIASASHKWSSQGDYEIGVQVKDDPNGDGDLTDGIESAWSESLTVSMPRTRLRNSAFVDLFDKIISKFPILSLLHNLFNFEIPKLKLSTFDPPPPPTEIKLDEVKCEITITIRIQIWGEGASDALASSMETAIENLLNKDKEGKPWVLKCPKEECEREDPGCAVKIDMIIKNAGNRPPKSGQGYHVFYVAAPQSGLAMNLGGKRFVSHTYTADANKNDNIVDYPRPNDATTNYPLQGDTKIFHNGGTVGCLHANDIVGTWAHEFLHCMGLDDKYTETWVDADFDGVRDASEVTTRPKPGHEDDIMANATKWLQQSAINLTMARINLKCPCKCCPEEEDDTPPENNIQTPNNGSVVSSPIIVGGYADDGYDGSGVAYLDYKLEWDGGEYDGTGYEVDPPETYVEYELGPLNLEPYIEEGDWITITTYATDVAGNTGEDSITVTWEDAGDTTPPVTEKTIGQPQWQDGYLVTALTPIWLDAVDPEPGTGVDYIHYEVWWDSDGNSEVDVLMCSEDVSGDNVEIMFANCGVIMGIVDLRWYAVDMAENVEVMHYQEHNVVE